MIQPSDPANDMSPYHEARHIAQAWRPPLGERMKLVMLAVVGVAIMLVPIAALLSGLFR